ncbi:hypothetical protein T492DRAFT_1093806 [Pavlovales sp. CCMP2436]|nr:hypothetical protein T492DRAFT_1093806 [Pavlovales sp. CCMP2436]
MSTPVPATSAPFQSPATPVTASPRRPMQVLSGLPAVTITAPTPAPPTPPVYVSEKKVATPALTRTKSAGRNATIASAYTEYPEAGASSKPYEKYQSPPTINELKQIGKMSDLRTRPAKSPQGENAQIARLMSNEIILQKVIKKYGDLSTKGGRGAIGITIDKFMTMRRTGGM